MKPIIGSVFLLCATILGAGILSMPYVHRIMGIYGGLFLILLIGIASTYSIFLLSETVSMLQSDKYEALGQITFGVFGRLAVVLCTLILLFGAMTSYVIIIGDVLSPPLQWLFQGGHLEWMVTRHAVMIEFTMCVIFPLCLLRHVRSLEYTSVLAVLIIITFSGFVVYNAYHRDHEDVDIASQYVELDYFESGWNIYLSIPIISLAFACQTTLLPIQSSLNRNMNCDSYEKTHIQKAGVIAMALCGALFSLVGAYGYLSYGNNTEGDFFKNFPTHSPFYTTIRILFAISIMFHYPLVHYPFRYTLEAVLFHTYNTNNNLRHFLETLMVVVGTLGLAILLPGLATAFELTGAITAFPLCFILPSAFYLRALFMRPEHKTRLRIFVPSFMFVLFTGLWFVSVGVSFAQLSSKTELDNHGHL